MTAAIWPPIPPEQLLREEEDTLAKELQWLLSSLQDTLQSLKAGLDECATLLAPGSGGNSSSSSSSTLALSSFRSEAVKGFATRVGTRIVKGDISLRLPSIPLPRGQQSYKVAINPPPPSSQPNPATTTDNTSPSSPSTSVSPPTSSADPPPPLILPQLVQARTHINSALDAVDAARWAGDTHDAGFIAGQFRLLQEHVSDARQALRGTPEMEEDEWWREAVDVDTFTPPLPPTIAFHLFIRDAALVLQLRTLELLPPLPYPANDKSDASFNSNKNNNNNTRDNEITNTSSSASALTSFTSFKDQLAVALGGVGLRSSGNVNSNSNSNNINNNKSANATSPTAQQHEKTDGGGGGGSGGSGGSSGNKRDTDRRAHARAIANTRSDVDSLAGTSPDGTYTYRGQRVRVKERVRVGTQDPALMAALAKLGALEHHVAVNRNSLRIVMGGGIDRGDETDSSDERDEREDSDDSSA